MLKNALSQPLSRLPENREAIHLMPSREVLISIREVLFPTLQIKSLLYCDNLVDCKEKEAFRSWNKLKHFIWQNSGIVKGDRVIDPEATHSALGSLLILDKIRSSELWER